MVGWYGAKSYLSARVSNTPSRRSLFRGFFEADGYPEPEHTGHAPNQERARTDDYSQKDAHTYLPCQPRIEFSTFSRKAIKASLYEMVGSPRASNLAAYSAACT